MSAPMSMLDADHILQFAQMGVSYAEDILKISFAAGWSAVDRRRIGQGQ